MISLKSKEEYSTEFADLTAPQIKGIFGVTEKDPAFHKLYALSKSIAEAFYESNKELFEAASFIHSKDTD